MKKKLPLIILILLIILGVGGFILFLFTKEDKEEIKGDIVPQIVLNDNGSPIFVAGELLDTSVSSKSEVFVALNQLADMYGFEDAKDEFEVISVEEVLTFKYYKVVQKFKNIPVYGNQLVVAVDANNNVMSVTGHYLKDIDVNTYSKLSIKDALTMLESSIGGENTYISEVGHYIYVTDEEEVYNSYIYTVLSPLEYSDYVVDAMTGEVIDILGKRTSAAEDVTLEGADGKEYTISLNGDQGLANSYHFTDLERNITIVDASGISLDFGTEDDIKWINTLTFLLYDWSGNLPIIAVKNNNGDFVYVNDDGTKGNIIPSAVVAMANYAKTYDYYKNVLGRDSYDNKGSEIIVNIGVQKDVIASRNSNNEHVNACWRGGDESEFYFGSSKGLTLAAGLDIVAHEFTHGVTENVAGLVYKGESGALNEAYSDIMGSLIEGRNFNIGEDVLAMRNMANPNEYSDPAIKDGKYYFPTDEETYNKEWQDKIMKAYEEAGRPLEKWQDWDNEGVHTNSGVPNYAAYLMYENGAFSSKEEMAKVWYSAQFMLTSTATFEDAALAVIQAAQAMGLKDEKVEIIKEAFVETNMLDREYTEISGVVKDAKDNKVIEGAQVTLISKKNVHVNYITKTNENGEFALSEVPIGEYNVVVEKAKYKAKEQDVKLVKDKKADVEIKIDKIPEGEYKESEIIFVLDISASMTTSDPEDIRKQMMVNVIASLDENAEVALVTYAKGANVVNNGLSNKKVDKKILMTDVFNMVNDSGHTDNSGTNGRAGLGKALELFTDNKKSRKYIVFFTDGVDNHDEGMSYEEIIKQANNKGIRILSVGLGKDSDIDETQLKNLANSTNGKYYHADDSGDLYGFDESIFEELE